MTRLRSCVQPYTFPMFLPSEGLYGTVEGGKISFSRFGPYDRYGPMYQFTGSIKPLDAGAELVGAVRVKWYYPLFHIAAVCFVVFFFTASFALHGLAGGGPPWPYFLIFPVWFILVFGMMTLYMRRSAEGAARYISLVVGNAFSQPLPDLVVN